jgi:putative aldouronate transport system permease protein
MNQLGKKHFAQPLLLLMLLPAIAYFIIFQYIPMAGVLLAFKQYDIRGGFFGSPWVGFANFRFLWASGKLWTVTRNTILYNLAFMFTTHIAAMCVAVFISEMRGKAIKKIGHSLLFLPYFVSFVILGVFVYNMFSYEFGSLNTFLIAVGADPVNVYEHKWAWPFILTFFNLWKWVGYSSIIYLAVVVAIDKQLFEAADIEGANLWQRTFHITVPHLTPTFVIILLLQLGRIMRGQFDLFYNIIGNNSQLFELTDVVDTFVFRSLIYNFDVGMSTAAGLFQSTFGLGAILLVNTIVRRLRPDYALF